MYGKKTKQELIDMRRERWPRQFESANGIQIQEGQIVIYNLSGDLVKGVVRNIGWGSKPIFYIDALAGTISEEFARRKDDVHTSRINNRMGIWVLPNETMNDVLEELILTA